MTIYFRICQGDITDIPVDAIVNAANRELCGGGGVDGAIHHKAGPGLLAECKTLGGCNFGDAKVTGAYNLPAKWVIHTVGPIWWDGREHEVEVLASCYRRCLEEADKLGAVSISFPAISTGAYNFPRVPAALTALATLMTTYTTTVRHVILVCFDTNTHALYETALKQFRGFI